MDFWYDTAFVLNIEEIITKNKAKSLYRNLSGLSPAALFMISWQKWVHCSNGLPSQFLIGTLAVLRIFIYITLEIIDNDETLYNNYQVASTHLTTARWLAQPWKSWELIMALTIELASPAKTVRKLNNDSQVSLNSSMTMSFHGCVKKTSTTESSYTSFSYTVPDLKPSG